ncbi:hypothetical protein [Limnohabitans lacus]|uniref:Sugar ABC transporter permease n=1 Tax=Limnohabitans lacus TaxID=3045173 RepID=A0ABT6X6U1_9BURK|nr:hypothetical protein [Limnohabitans sp. HM2-2]MDI9233844.1 hypothetical protein [Limnohabitans sp. HM2-2]
MSPIRWHQDWAPYVFVLPFVLLFLVFGLFPIAFSLYLVFNAWDPVQGVQHSWLAPWLLFFPCW